MQSFLTGYLIASLFATGLVVAAGLWTRHVRTRETWPETHRGAIGTLDLSQAPADVRTCAMIAMKRLIPAMRLHGIRADIAIGFGLLVRMTGLSLTDLLEAVLTAAIHHAPRGRILIAAMPSGGQVSIGITDDAAGADPAERRASLRSLTERAALLGIGLDIAVSPADGTTLTMRLPAAAFPVAARPVPQGPADTTPATQPNQPEPIGSKESVDG